VGVHFVSGVLARLDGDYERSLRYFERMIRLNPAERVVASYNRARIFTYQGEYEQAQAELDEGAKVEPDHPLIRTFRARTLYYHGEPTKAAEILEEVLEQHPQLDGIRPIYATFLSALGFNEEARAQLTEEVRNTANTDHDVAYWLAFSVRHGRRAGRSVEVAAARHPTGQREPAVVCARQKLGVVTKRSRTSSDFEFNSGADCE
jgi:tetratricopeptide (TPR) repeat protein